MNRGEPADAISIEPLVPARLDDYLRFFDTRAFTDNPQWDGCYCFYPLHDPEQTNWRQRTGPENREAIQHCILDNAVQGYLAYQAGEVVGWCNAGPRALYPMLRGRAETADTTGAITCFIVAPEQRGRGIARQLLAAACDGLRLAGCTSVEARPTRGASTAAENHLGPLSTYLDAGFAIVSERPDGIVRVRKQLA